ncbi:hypothetical protein LCGC14_2995370 [marine sediment metagenome]|uniref:Uncharacterized protein n=1 Tax=marine sediment metagenome TaxID=412755 RepID=A0A0F8XQ79_9ZZZZ
MYKQYVLDEDEYNEYIYLKALKKSLENTPLTKCKQCDYYKRMQREKYWEFK